MFATTRTAVRLVARSLPGPSRKVFRLGWGSWLLILALLPAVARAQEEAVEGLFVTVPNPITSEASNRVKEISNRAVLKFKSNDAGAGGARKTLTIVFDFSPSNNGPSATPDFGPCYDLAKHLQRLQDVNTVAFLHGEVTRHTVLPVLACRQIAMSSEAKIGDVLGDAANSQDDADLERAAYKQIIKDRRCPAVVLKMLDPDMVVLKAKNLKDGGEWFIDQRLQDEEQRHGIGAIEPEPVVPRGKGSTLYTAKQARDLGLCQRIKESRQEVASAYGLPPTSLRADPLMGRTPIAWRIDVNGVFTQGLAETLERRIRRAMGQNANLIILQIGCAGGDTKDAREFAEFLLGLSRQDPPVMTIAYIPDKAPDTATFVAFGCNAIVMKKDAVLGDFSSIVHERQGNKLVEAPPAKYKSTRDSLKGLAEAQGYSGLLAEAMLDRDLVLLQVVPTKGPRKWQLVTQEEYKADQASKERQWMNEIQVKPPGEFLTLNSQKAKELELAQYEVDGLPALYELYGLNPFQVHTSGPDWLEQFADFLVHPLTSFFLVMIGIVCLILELKLSGVGLPGVISAVCFILFFWSHSHVAGQFTILAILLFILGLVLLALEIFVLPGFGVAGISGTVLVIVSLALVTLDKRPETREEWLSLGSTLATFSLSLLAAIVAAMTVAWYLPYIPYLNRVMMKSEEELDEAGEGPSPDLIQPQLAALLGAIGVAATPLRPAGKVKFGDEYLDVVAEGSFVQPGTRVQVIEIEGNRVVVKEV
jgi:membrane-bound ClpP family serine protease